MIRRVLSWLGYGRVEKETIGASVLPREVGEKILRARPLIQDRVREIRHSIAALGLRSLRDDIERFLIRFALFVLDLPASEKRHGSGPFGLLEHSLDVARLTLAGIERPEFRFSREPVENRKARSEWALAALVLALLHDAGKVSGLTVRTPKGREVWNPHVEALAGWKARHGLPVVGGAEVLFRYGRGYYAHEARSREFVSLLVPISLRRELGRNLTDAFDAKLFSSDPEFGSLLPDAALRVATLVGRADASGREKDEAPKIVAETPQPKPKIPPATSQELFLDLDRASRFELSPDRLEKTLRQSLRQGVLCRNLDQASAYIREDRVWFVVPETLRELSQIAELPETKALEEKFLLSFARIPGAVRFPGGSVECRALPRSDSRYSKRFVALRTEGFMSPEDRAALGVWRFEIRPVKQETKKS